MVDIYILAIQQEDNVQDFLNRIELDAVKAPVLIQALGKLDMAEYTDINVLQKLLTLPSVKPSAAAFNALISTWRKSTQPDELQQAENVVKLMTEHPKCIKLGLQPNGATMEALANVSAKLLNASS